MYRAIQNFTIGTTSYRIGDTIADSDVAEIEADSHYQKFVVRVSSDKPSFPTP